MVGLHARTWPRTLKSILAAHEIGNHTEMHRVLSGLAKPAIETELLSLQAYLRSTYGVRPRFFRPPEGKINGDVIDTIRSAGMDLILWDVDSIDWTRPGFLKIARTVAEETKPGSIILMHTLNPQTVETLPVLIEYLQAAGFRLVPVSELLNRPAYLDTSPPPP